VLLPGIRVYLRIAKSYWTMFSFCEFMCFTARNQSAEINKPCDFQSRFTFGLSIAMYVSSNHVSPFHIKSEPLFYVDLCLLNPNHWLLVVLII
jgi:hypothetical protein